MTTGKVLNEMMSTIPNYNGFFLYNQLHNIPVSMMDNKFIVINYVTTEEARKGIVGHWVVLDNRRIIKGEQQNTKNDLFFFDSYGFAPDIPRNLMGLPNTGEITKFIDRVSNPYKYVAPHRSMSLLLQPPRFKRNVYDFQAKIKGDDTCGVYSFIYAENPNYLTNPILNIHNTDRAQIDEKLTDIAEKYGVITTSIA